MRRMLTAIGGAIAALAATWVTPAGAAGGGQTVVASPVAVPVSGALTQRQKQDLAGPVGLAPGVYRLRNLHSGHCLVFVPTGSANNHANKIPVPVLGHLVFAALSLPFVPSERAHFKQGRCTYESSDARAQAQYAPQYRKLTEFWVLPHPQGGVTIRTEQPVGEGEREAGPGQIVNCATVARGVLLGAPRIDFHSCDVEPGRSEWRFAGAGDQRFRAVVKPGGNVTFAIGESNCWALRNGSRDLGTDVLQWECTGGADQVYSLDFVRPLDGGIETSLFPADSWYPTASGYRWIRGAGGVSFQANPYAQFDTANDNGAYCAKRCAELDQCKAWTWMGPGYVANSADPPRCMWFDQVSTAISRGEAMMTKLRSGVVR